jgi:hypothetical protein
MLDFGRIFCHRSFTVLTSSTLRRSKPHALIDRAEHRTCSQSQLLGSVSLVGENNCPIFDSYRELPTPVADDVGHKDAALITPCIVQMPAPMSQYRLAKSTHHLAGF